MGKKKSKQRAVPFDTTKTLEQLEGCVWESPTGFVTGLILTCHQLRRVPLAEMTIENLRVLIGQHIGLKFLVPVALEILKQNPLAEGDFYAGDLLCNVLQIDPAFWEQYPYWRQDTYQLISLVQAQSTSVELNKTLMTHITTFLAQATD